MREAYERLKAEYLKTICHKHSRLKYNPPKNNFELAYVNGIVTKSTNVMSAQTKHGVFTKVISLDDVSGRVNEDIIYTDNDMNVHRYADIGLTPTRCALMACLAADLNCYVTPDTVIGFIGNGRINIKTCEMFNKLFGVHNFIIRGSKNNRAKNKDRFEQYGTVTVDYTESLEILNKCDVVICCTNSYCESDLIDSKKLRNPALIIAQDSGFLLGESFRKDRVNYTDHKEQLVAHYKSEFPFDKREARLRVMKDTRTKKGKKSVYLYGIALADAIIFEELFIKEKQK